MRLTIVTNTPTPYRTALYDELDRRLRDRGGRLAVVYGTRNDPGRQWSPSGELAGAATSYFLRRARLKIRGRSTYVNPLVVRLLRRTRPDVVVVGGYAPWIYAAVLWCRSTRTPFLVWSGETVETARRRGAKKARRWPILRLANGYLAYGPAARDYLCSMGIAGDRITVVGNGIDVDGYARKVDDARNRRDQIRERLGLHSPAVLSVGAKNLDLLISALELLDRRVQAVVVGATPSGRAHPAMMELGKRPPQEMPDLYAAADCLAHPTLEDRWPHAINEALSGGIPVVASRLTGVPDSILAGPGCSIVDGDPTAFANGIERALAVSAPSSPEARKAIRDPLRPWAVDRMAERMCDAAEAVIR
jgi:glycosyltransferase involved in cell wall biosynthesis